MTIKIEALRQKLFVTAKQKGLESPETLQISRQLDQALNYLMGVNQKISNKF